MNQLEWVFGILALLLAAFNLVRREWATSIVALALQYLTVFFLLLGLRPPNLALVKLLTGWMATLVLYLTLASSGLLNKPSWPPRFSPSQGMRLIMGVLVIIVVWNYAPNLQVDIFPSASRIVLAASTGLMILGMLQVGMREEPIYLITALLTFFSGFELLYASLEFSTVLEGLFALLNLGVALVGAYLIVKQSDYLLEEGS